MQQPGEEAPLTPQPGTEVPSPAMPPPERPGPKTHLLEPNHTKLIIIAVVAIIALAVVAVYITKVLLPPVTTTTTVSQASLNEINSCGRISSPGTYTVPSGISTGIGSGACINITGSNIALSCGGHSIRGSGPYSGVPPFTYGIRISGSSDSVSGCSISNFSYGVFAGPGSSISIYGNNVTDNYVSNIYLGGASNSSVYANRLYGSVGSEGSIYLTNGSKSDSIHNNTVLHNGVYGIVINSSGSSFYDNYLNGSPYSFYCSVNGGLKGGNSGYGNICLNNSGCSFLECSGLNAPTNLSQIALSGNVSSCGTISSPGTYNLQQGINVGELIDVNGAIASGRPVPCITIGSPDVVLNCRGFAITNALIGILASRQSNITLNGCGIDAYSAGVEFYNVTDSHINNAYVRDAATGILLDNSSVDFLNNVTILNNSYGLYMINSTTDTVSGFAAINNTYGLYVDHSIGNIFNKGTVLNNTDFDVYATVDSANASYNLMSSTSCGYTNAVWASCKRHISSSLVYTPVTSCSSIRKAGNYSLTDSLVTSFSSCISVHADNVRLNCNGHTIAPGASSNGYAVSIFGSRNVTVRGCSISAYAYGINATNSSRVTIENDTLSGNLYGVLLKNVSGSLVSNTSISVPSKVGLLLTGSNNDTISRVNASTSLSGGIGVELNSSSMDTVKMVFGTNNDYGFVLNGRSLNNTIYNNTETGNNAYDFACYGPTGGIASQYGGVNYGGVKSGCGWLAVVTPLSNMQCRLSYASNLFSYASDEVYSYGDVCYTAFSNTTEINCNGHTLLATNGGTLIQAHGAKVKIENCMIKGFSSIIQSYNSTGLTLTNDTIYINRSGGTLTPINVSGGSDPIINYNNISSPYYGIYLTSTSFGTMSHNRVYGRTAAYVLTNVSGMKLQDNIAAPGSGIGLLLDNSSALNIQDNQLNGNLFGLDCLGRSQGSSAASDSGGNSCTSQYKCQWISTSSQSCS